MGIIDILTVDTTPGQYPDNPFSPPAGWDGDGEAFVQLLRERFQRDPWLRQWLGIMAFRKRRGDSYTIIGPWKQDMEAIIASVISRLAVLETMEEDANG